MYRLGEAVKPDYDRARQLYGQAAEQGDPLAQYSLGEMCKHGEGRDADLVQAADWYRQSAEQGCVEAQHALAYMYEHGEGVEQDLDQAQSWYAKANGKYEDARSRLADMRMRLSGSHS